MNRQLLCLNVRQLSVPQLPYCSTGQVFNFILLTYCLVSLLMSLVCLHFTKYRIYYNGILTKVFEVQLTTYLIMSFKFSSSNNRILLFSDCFRCVDLNRTHPTTFFYFLFFQARLKKWRLKGCRFVVTFSIQCCDGGKKAKFYEK